MCTSHAIFSECLRMYVCVGVVWRYLVLYCWRLYESGQLVGCAHAFRYFNFVANICLLFPYTVMLLYVQGCWCCLLVVCANNAMLLQPIACGCCNWCFSCFFRSTNRHCCWLACFQRFCITLIKCNLAQLGSTYFTRAFCIIIYQEICCTHVAGNNKKGCLLFYEVAFK